MNLSKQPIFVLYKAREGSPPEPMFAFHAPTLDAAETARYKWTRYHGISSRDYGVEENPLFRESNVCMRDDYVDHSVGRAKLLYFSSYQSPSDAHPLPVECHIVQGKLSKESVKALLVEVAEQQFNGRRFKIWENMSDTSREQPAFGLAAEDLEVGRFIVPVLRK